MTSQRSTGLCALLALAILALAAVPARADDNVGVVVTGEATMQPQLVAQIETWLRMHGHELVSTPLPPEAVSALIDCFVIEDPECARKVVEKRAKSDAIVFAQVSIATGASSSDRTVTITIHWLDKGKESRSKSRDCNRCTDVTMRSTADALMSDLTGDDTPRGRVRFRSKPDGAKVSVGGQVIGETPIADRLPPGQHEITFEQQGRPAQRRSITIEAGKTATVSVSFGAAPMPLRTKIALASLIGGAAMAIGGGVLLAIDENDSDARQQVDQYYYDTAPAGVALAAAGAVALGVGVYLMVRKPSARKAPVVSVTPGGGVIGWAWRY
jgi:hypothetical protein